MVDGTALERSELVVPGDRAELRLEHGRITITKQAPTRDAPTEVAFEVGQVRAAQVQAPTRGARGWLHLAVVGGSPTPPGEIAAVGDPYTLPITSRSVGAARRLVRLVDRHVRERGMPSDTRPATGRISTSVAVTAGPGTTPPPAPHPSEDPAASRTGPSTPPPPPPRTPTDPAELVAELRELAALHAEGALSDAEFERAKARILG